MTATDQQQYDVGGVMLDRPFKIRRLGHFGLHFSRRQVLPHSGVWEIVESDGPAQVQVKTYAEPWITQSNRDAIGGFCTIHHQCGVADLTCPVAFLDRAIDVP